MTTESKRLLTMLGGVAIIALFVLGYRVLTVESFIPGKWANASPETRDRLMDRLAQSEQLLGLSKEELVEMLGQPDLTIDEREVCYCGRYLEGGVLKKRLPGASRCLYIDLEQGIVTRARYVGS